MGPWWWDLYAREYGLPGIEAHHGFKYGPISFQRDGVGPTLYGIVDLDRDSALARLGRRLHDVPWSHHGHGDTAFYFALSAIERGQAASFEVINLDDWSIGDGARPRTIEIPAR